jgi:superfamily II DNA/RNA helicase
MVVIFKGRVYAHVWWLLTALLLSTSKLVFSTQVTCHACVGGTSVREDTRILDAGKQVVVGTPGRVYDMLRRRALRADSIRTFIIAEADELLTGSFKAQIHDIFQLLPPKPQVHWHHPSPPLSWGKRAQGRRRQVK